MTIQRLWKFLPFVLAQRTACRSFTFLVLLALMFMGLPALSGAQQDCLPDGDVDQNGNVTAADALLAFQQALGLAQLDACQLTIANVFPSPDAPDGNITASDALCIFQKALSLPSCLSTLPSPNEPPMADAGSDQTVDAGTIVTLSGTADDTDGTIVSYGWEQTGGTMVSLTGAASATVTFTAPDVPMDETLTFRLTVTDNGGAQASDEVNVTVRPVVREVEQDALKVSVFGEGDIRVVGAGEPLDCTLITICQGFFDEGSEVVLEAAPDSDWTHERWVGCDEVDSTRCTVFMDGDRFVSVTFLSTAPLELEDDVIVVQDDQLNGIIEYDADDGWLAFDANTVGVSQWAVGDILLSDGFDTDGSMAFARRIVSIDDEPGRVTFHTIQASLDEIFRSGSISYHGQNHGDDRQRSDGPVVAQSADLTFEVGIVEGGVKASGTVDLPLDPEFAINFSPFEVRLIMHAEARGNIAIEISAMIDRMGQQELCIKGRCSIKLGTIPVGYGITVSPHLKVLATYEAEAAGRIRPSMYYGISASAGAHYKSGQGLKPIFKAGVDPGSGVVLSEYELELHAEIGLRAELQFKIEAGIFASVGPHVGFGPAFGVQSECNAAYANVYGGLRLTVGGELELLGGSLRYDIPAWERKWAIKALYPPGKTPPDPTDTMVTSLTIIAGTLAGWTLAWDPPRNNCGIAGYVIYRNNRSIARNITDTYFMGIIYDSAQGVK